MIMKPFTNEILPQGYKMTELGALPEEWEVVRLGDYCNIFSGYAFKSDDFCNDGVLVVKIGNLQNGSIVLNDKESFFPREKINDDISKFILNEGDILMALTGATTGKIALVPKSVNGALLNQRVGKFSIYNSSLYSSFAKYYFMTDEFQDTIKKNILQSAQGNISPKQIETFKLPLPPLPEQQKIAAVLSAVQEAKEKTEMVIAAAKALKKSMMKHLFTYGPVSPQEAENVPLKETEIGPVPENWEVVRLGDLSKKNLINIQFGFPSGKWNDKKIGIAQLRPFNITENGETDLSVLKYIESDKDISKYLIQKEDIIFNNTNSEELVGKTAYWKYENDKYVLSNHMTIIRIVDKNIMNAYFLAKYLHKKWSDGFYRTVCRRHVNQSSISLARLNEIKIPLPPLPTQQKIASILSAIDEKIEAEENKKKALEELFKSLLHNLMTAKIRVNQLEISS